MNDVIDACRSTSDGTIGTTSAWRSASRTWPISFADEDPRQRAEADAPPRVRLPRDEQLRGQADLTRRTTTTRAVRSCGAWPGRVRQLWSTIASAKPGLTGPPTGISTGRLPGRGTRVVPDDRATGGGRRSIPRTARSSSFCRRRLRAGRCSRSIPRPRMTRQRYDAPHPDDLEQELTAYAGSDGQLTTWGWIRRATLVEPMRVVVVQRRWLASVHDVHLAVWNGSGDGTNSVAGTHDERGGCARFDVPLQAAFALTTLPVS